MKRRLFVFFVIITFLLNTVVASAAENYPVSKTNFVALRLILKDLNEVNKGLLPYVDISEEVKDRFVKTTLAFTILEAMQDIKEVLHGVGIEIQHGNRDQINPEVVKYIHMHAVSKRTHLRKIMVRLKRYMDDPVFKGEKGLITQIRSIIEKAIRKITELELEMLKYKPSN